ncbi:MAG: GNAT family N-acetyltransferase [Acidobacteriia bacterium]|nr:GNAT family N-acetyltransferase [Terriglobia bacterium]
MPVEIVLVRQFQPEDAEACSNLVRACMKSDPMMPPTAREQLLRAESAGTMCERASLFYIAVGMLGGGVAGVGGVDMNEIRFLFVEPGRQRRGVGSSLLKHLEALVPPALFGDIFVYSAPGAVGFYRSHGYQSGGEHAFAVGDCAVSTIFMSKRLSD